MSWIRSIPYRDATGPLKLLYDRIKGPDDTIDNILKIHGLRPHTLKGHMTLYKNVLHHRDNTLPKWLLEAIGVYVSCLNDCDYCVRHHFVGMSRLLGDKARSADILRALERGRPGDCFAGRDLVIMEYAAALTLRPQKLTESTIDQLRGSGLDDGEILEINQVTSYFAYANRTVLGLGVTTRGDIIGLAPSDSDSEDNWQHH
jgi:uncharacterized peroxidase-related enzyme